MNRFTSLESFRALLCWWVVMSHTLTYTGFNKREMEALSAQYTAEFGNIISHLYDLALIILSYLKYGKIPVYVFIIISGFVIAHLLKHKKESYPVYLMRRFLRLWPALFAVLIVALVFREIGSPFRGKHSDDSFWLYFFSELTMLQGLIPNEVLDNGAGGITGVGWSVSLEWQFYIIAPFLIGAILNKGWRIYAVLAALLLFAFFGALNDRAFVVGDSTYSWNHPGALPQMIGFFFLGIISHFALDAVRQRKAVSSALIIAAALMLFNFEGPEGQFLPIMIWAILYTTIITSGTTVHKVMEAKPLRWLGDISYSTYISHIFVLSFVEGKIVRANGLGEADTFEKLAYLMLISWPIILIVSWLSYKFVEKPGIALGRHLATKYSAAQSLKSAENNKTPVSESVAP